MTKISRNAPCPCGSGLKYKRCCETKEMDAKLDEILEHESAAEARHLGARVASSLPEIVYENVLYSVWSCLGADLVDSSVGPSLGDMEKFFREIYGRDLDRTALNWLVPMPSQEKLKEVAKVSLLSRLIHSAEAGELPP